MKTEEFSAQFHSLTGVTIGERHKNFFLFLNTIDPNELDVDFSKIQPKTSLEEKLKIDALIHFKRVSDLLEILKCENVLLIRRVLKKCSWFIDEAFKNVRGPELITAIFSHICLKAKLKIINQLCRKLQSTLQADEYFDAIKNRYGLYLASKLLASCSLEKILLVIKSHKIKFTNRQMKAIIRRYPENAEEILNIVKSYSVEFNDQYEHLFKYVSQNDMPLFLKLRKQHQFKCRIGWRITEKYVQNHKTEVLEQYDQFYKFFNSKRLIKTLGNDYQKVFMKLFPTSIDNYERHAYSIFSHFENLPEGMKDINLLLDSFEKSYNIPLLSDPKYITENILKMVSLEQRAAALVLEKQPSRISLENWYCFFKTDISIPYFLERIFLTSDIVKRTSIICCLVKACCWNNDMAALARMCGRMVEKHRNDHVSIRGKFLKTLEEEIDLRKLDKSHWDNICKLIKIFYLNGEHFSQGQEYLRAYIFFRLENQLPIEEELTELFKEYGGSLNILKDKPKYEKQCLLLSYQVISNIYKNDKGNLHMHYSSYLEALMNWNKRHPEDEISLLSYPVIIQYIKDSIKEKEHVNYLDRIMKYILLKEPDNEETKLLLNSYLHMPLSYVSSDILNYLIKYRPLYVCENVENFTKLAITKSYWRDDYFFWIFSKNYTHLGIPQKMIPLCREAHQNNEGAIVGLSHLMSTEEFLDFLTPYYPVTLKHDASTDEGRKLYETLRLITKHMLNIQPASAILPSVFKFCKGDYLKLIIRTLYSACDSTNEDKLMEFISSFINNAVSVRKHAIHLSFRLLDETNIFEVLSRFMEAETSASIRQFLFKGIFKHFVKNPDNKTWELTKLHLDKVNVADEESLAILMEVDKIPSEYIPRYIIFTWNILDKYEDKYLSQKRTLLVKVSLDIMRLFPKDFCEKIIDRYFFSCDDCSLTMFQSTIQTFTCKFIVHSNSISEQEQLLVKYFDVATKFASAHHDDPNERNGSRNCVANFLKEFCLLFIDLGCTDKPILHKFVELWNNFVQPHQAFQEYLHLQFTLIYVEKLSLTEIGRKIAQVFDSTINACGIAAVNLFYKYLKFFLKYFYGGNETESNKMDLIESIAECNNSIPRLLLVILLLSIDGQPSDEAVLTKYNALVDIIKSNPDPTVQIFFTSYLMDSITLDYY